MKTIKKITTRLLSVIAISFLLMSCEGNTNREWIVKNNSSTTIKVEAGLVFNTSTVTKNIAAGSSEIITITEQRGGTATPQTPSDVFSSMIITNAATDSLNKDYKLAANWKATIEQTKKRPSLYEHEYILNLTDQDF